jgi:hypothetical protein
MKTELEIYHTVLWWKFFFLRTSYRNAIVFGKKFNCDMKIQDG